MPVEVSFDGIKKTIVGLIDTGADETVISERLAKEINAKLHGTYRAICASGFFVTGRYSFLSIKELREGKEAKIEVGVSDIPFDTDEINEEGLGIILGVDFIQEANMKVN